MIGSHLCVGVQAPLLSKYLLLWSKQFIILLELCLVEVLIFQTLNSSTP